MANRIKLKGTSERVFDIGLENKQVFDASGLTATRTWTLPDSDGSSGYALTTDGAGGLSWAPSGTGLPAGSDKQVQFNNAGVFGASASLEFDQTVDWLKVGKKETGADTSVLTLGADAADLSSGVRFSVTSQGSLDINTVSDNVTEFGSGGNININTGTGQTGGQINYATGDGVDLGVGIAQGGSMFSTLGSATSSNVPAVSGSYYLLSGPATSTVDFDATGGVINFTAGRAQNTYEGSAATLTGGSINLTAGPVTGTNYFLGNANPGDIVLTAGAITDIPNVQSGEIRIKSGPVNASAFLLSYNSHQWQTGSVYLETSDSNPNAIYGGVSSGDIYVRSGQALSKNDGVLGYGTETFIQVVSGSLIFQPGLAKFEAEFVDTSALVNVTGGGTIIRGGAAYAPGTGSSDTTPWVVTAGATTIEGGAIYGNATYAGTLDPGNVTIRGGSGYGLNALGGTVSINGGDVSADTSGDPLAAGAGNVRIRSGRNNADGVSRGYVQLSVGNDNSLKITSDNEWAVGAALDVGTAGQVLTSNGAGSSPTWQDAAGGLPAGSNTEIQFNDSGAFGADAALTFDKTTGILEVSSLQIGSMFGQTLILGTDNTQDITILPADSDNTHSPQINIVGAQALTGNATSGNINIITGPGIGTGTTGNILIRAVPTSGAISNGLITLQGGSTFEISTAGEWKVNGSDGGDGQFLKSRGAGYAPIWDNVTVPLSSLTDAVAVNTLHNGIYTQQWGFDLDNAQFTGLKLVDETTTPSLGGLLFWLHGTANNGNYLLQTDNSANTGQVAIGDNGTLVAYADGTVGGSVAFGISNGSTNITTFNMSTTAITMQTAGSQFKILDTGQWEINSSAGSGAGNVLATDISGIPNWTPISTALGYTPAAAGANSDITSLSGITGGISTVDYIDFDTAATVTPAVGRLRWNDTDGTLEVGLKGGAVTLQIGQEEVIRVLNNTGSALTDGQVVYITGASGNRPTVALAQANSEATSKGTIGFVTEPIADNHSGFITTSGIVRDIDTSAFTEGATIYLSATTAGAYTATAPTAPDHNVILGYVIRAHATVGQIFVKVDNGYELDELHNVLITSPTNGQVLTYDSATTVWKNQSLPETLSPFLLMGG